MGVNFRQIYAIEKSNKEKLIKHFGEIPDTSGIYILTREENNFKYSYIGQAKHILTRLAQHLSGYQHIDLSLKKHGLFSIENMTGWRVTAVINYNEDLLDAMEKYYIMKYANLGYQLYNHTTGSQGVGKKVLGEQKERKGYNQGLNNGYKKAINKVREFFDKYLDVIIKGKTSKIKERKLKEFREFLNEETS